MGLRLSLLLLSVFLALPAFAQQQPFDLATPLQNTVNQIYAMIMQILPIILPLMGLILGISLARKFLSQLTK